MADILVEVAGWAGALLILAAYLLLTAGRLHGSSPVYQGMNVLGAAGFIVNSAWHGAMPSAILNVVWMGIGLTALARIVRKERASASPE
ncbi:CBU_0592 family membrane protein [Allosphingosinicella vermicomposti]|uniref:CBU_0592 family membrane protein n=1 Tax=Allosphingosinicella vermicomposti TaxID=614671 RepID=UPI00315AB3D5